MDVDDFVVGHHELSNFRAHDIEVNSINELAKYDLRRASDL